jgi:hypothetical protein
MWSKLGMFDRNERSLPHVPMICVPTNIKVFFLRTTNIKGLTIGQMPQGVVFLF